MLKRLFGAFLCGGLIGVITQTAMALYASMGATPLLAIVFSLVTIGLIGVLLYGFGLYHKVERWGGFGVMATFVGLPPAIAIGIAAARAEGVPALKAIGKGLLPIALLILFGVAVTTVAAFAAHLL